MILHEFLPCTPLRDFIVCYQYIDTLDCGMPSFAPILPDGLFKIYWHFKDQNHHIYKDAKGKLLDWEDGIVGYSPERKHQFCLPQQYRSIAAIVRPSFFYKIFKIPADELNHDITSFMDLDLWEAEAIRPQLQAVRKPLEINYILDHFFLEKSIRINSEKDPIAFAEASIIDSHGTLNVGELANKVCLHPRTLERRFIKEVGTSPKVYARICRFKHLFELKCSFHNTWYDIIDRCQYHDQTHMIKDFKKITGQCPNLFFEHLSREYDCLPDEHLQDSNHSITNLFSYTYNKYKIDMSKVPTSTRYHVPSHSTLSVVY